MLVRKTHAGFSLLEVAIAVAVFLLFAVGIYSGITYVFKIVYQSRLMILETALLSEQLEVVRNLPYSDVGVVGGVPSGVLQNNRTIIRNGVEFSVTTTVRNIDDPFDGQVGGTPNDTSPADYKLVEMSVLCAACRQNRPLTLSTRVGPKNLENASQNGSLFIHVFDANGLPVSGTTVRVTNAAANVSITDVTGNDGYLRIIDTPTGTMNYHITVSKAGFSTDYTTSTSLTNPTPIKLPANVVSQAVTNISFSIDQLGSMSVFTQTPACVAIGSVPFSIRGDKLIGTNPSVYKYNQRFTTDSSGEKNLGQMEWDTYYLSPTSTSYDLAGSIPMIPMSLLPGMSQNVTLLLTPHTSNSVLVKVKDAGTGLPLSDATVRLVGTSYDTSKITGLGYVRQTDWSGGGGQTAYVDESRYASDNNLLQLSQPAGDMSLKRVGNTYLNNGMLESSTFDLGTGVNFNNIILNPTVQAAQTGLNPVLLQLATSNSSTPSTWNFLGPDGTADSYYTATSTVIYAGHNGERYLRYRVYLETADQAYTPELSEVAVTYTNACTAPGQSFFGGLSAGTYTIEVTRTGYATNSGTIDVSGTGEVTVNMSPEE